MPGTFSQILFHIVFATKHRRPWIDATLSEKLYPYLGGIVRSEGGIAYNVGGVQDHVHLMIRWKPDGRLSNLMRILKSRSSRWVHESQVHLADFAWQEGYSVFSVSHSNRDAVDRYIANQAVHHRKMDYKAELLRLLTAHAVEFNEQYLVD